MTGRGGPEPEFRCVECDRSPSGSERFRAYLTADDEVAVYCPDCSEREFGGDKREGKSDRGSS